MKMIAIHKIYFRPGENFKTPLTNYINNNTDKIHNMNFELYFEIVKIKIGFTNLGFLCPADTKPKIFIRICRQLGIC